MSLLVDGYNLLHASGILGRGTGPGFLERSRAALVNFLAESLDDRELERTTVVFDAAQAPPGLPRSMSRRGIAIRFAEGSGSADELIEQLIKLDSAPRKLVVVSSDHRIQRAALRRRAKAIDSDEWFNQVLRRRIDRRHSDPAAPAKPLAAPADSDVQYWLREFGFNASETDTAAVDMDPAAWHPFPPGYGTDVE